MIVWTFPGGAKRIDVTSVTLASNTQRTIDVSVPSGERWLLVGVKVTNPDSVTRTIFIYHYKEAAKTNLVELMGYVANLDAASATNYMIPSFSAATYVSHGARLPKVMDAGETLSIVWAAGGASGGGTDADGLVIERMEMDVG